MQSLEHIFGKLAADQYKVVSDKVIPNLKGTIYEWPKEIYETDAVLYKSIKKFNERYWLEMFGRIFQASAASLLRNHLWLDGVVQSYNNTQFLPFVANLRGFLESVADSTYSLRIVPRTLEDNITIIAEVLAQPPQGNKVAGCEELENQLIHFAYAKRHPKKTKQPISHIQKEIPNSHQVKTARHYLEVLEKYAKGVNPFYGELCQVMHPSAESVKWMFEIWNTPKSWEFEFIGKKKSKMLIEELMEKHSIFAEPLLMTAINYPLLCLKALRPFNPPNIPLNFMDKVALDHLMSWERTATKIEKSKKFLSQIKWDQTLLQ